MKINEAKRIIKNELDRLNLPYDKITAQTISFSDLARDSCIFVSIHGWQPNPKWSDIKKLAKDNGFVVEAE